MTYNFTIRLDTKYFEIQIDPVTQYGYFEHNQLGEDCAGGLWFNDKELVDYDGVFELPMEVRRALMAAGYDLGEDE